MSTTHANMSRIVKTAGPRKAAIEQEHHKRESRRCKENTMGPESGAIAATVVVRKME